MRFTDLFKNKLFWMALLTFLFAIWNILSPFGFFLDPDLASDLVALDWRHIPYAFMSAVMLILKRSKGDKGG